MNDLTYAIGDIHGCAGALLRLLRRINVHRAGRPARIVCLGDYVDRGPESAQVIAILRHLQGDAPNAITCLLGNHEQMMLDAYRDALGATVWLTNGGQETLQSFGIADPEDFPHDVLTWLSLLPTVHEDALRYYVHAGFRPGRQGIDPDVSARLWIREPFLSAAFDFGKHVVHGHTPQTSGVPDQQAFRTNLDTGCVYGGALTAGIFDETRPGPIGFLQVDRDDGSDR
ncbi:metallophosphoesterase [Methylobacterium sp. Leaf104]|uniref:metallophosphoesterase family protein n=1 Tax=Methylobacterium TaxID=407 RepID=UPI0006F260E0|nr:MULTISPECIES: metallophosphoesterase family protein [Methylobacterium]KQP33651.1 metallophosphoesterase [Methylobacterium sp. Leaf104]MCI9879804.1 serine/threonine protein phosphatase [Methylobacterium goesingense]